MALQGRDGKIIAAPSNIILLDPDLLKITRMIEIRLWCDTNHGIAGGGFGGTNGCSIAA